MTEVERLRRDLIDESEWTAEQEAILERRIAALEEVLAARWPRRWLLAARLRRDLRASVAGYEWAGGWYERRLEAVSVEMSQR